jgi:alkylation response protein AidB-like acyl-CoA dehydrogenase
MTVTLESQRSRVSMVPAAGEGPALLARVRELAPTLAGRAQELEEGRRTPLDIVEDLRSIGVFRMYVPKSHGGLELDFPTTLEVLTQLARAEGSIGWIAMIGAGSAPFFSRLPRQTYDEIYADGPDVIVAGSASPAGTAEEVPGGYRVSGRWPFASGCQHADWIFSGCLVTQGGKPAPGPVEGAPLVRHIVLPASAWTIEDTWKVSGLKGTGSCHIALKDLFVPDANVMNFGGESCLPGPLYASPLQLVPLMHCAPGVGIAEGALDDLAALASTGRRQLYSREPMRDSQLFQAEVGRIEAEVRAARALMEAEADRQWSRTLAGEQGPENFSTSGIQTAVWVTQTCMRAADACYSLGGGSALYDDSPLQRRMRDMRAAAQHAVVTPKNYVSAGAVRLGHPPRDPRLG